MAKLRESVISNCEKKFLIKNLEEHRRLDGRAFDEFRELHIEFSKDWGCCYASLGKTRVLAQVSCEVQQPKSSRPSEGILNINIELTPIGAPNFEAGRQSDLSVQLNRILEKCIKDSKAVDLESLCIKVGEKVWALRIDVNVLNHEGNIVDCASVAALAALAHFRRPDVSSDGEEIVVHTYSERDPIPTVLHHYPICVSYAIFNEGLVILADPTLLEERVADAYLTLGLNAYKELCGLHLGGSALLAPEKILQCTSKAAARAKIVIEQIKEVLERDRNDRIQKKVISFESSLQFFKDVDMQHQKLGLCLDEWSTKAQKKNRWRKKTEEKIEVDRPVSDAKVESLGEGLVVLLPSEENHNVWAESSEEESEPDIAMSTNVDDHQNLGKEPIGIKDDGDSEEENVVVLNASSKRNTKKRQRIK